MMHSYNFILLKVSIFDICIIERLILSKILMSDSYRVKIQLLCKLFLTCYFFAVGSVISQNKTSIVQHSLCLGEQFYPYGTCIHNFGQKT
jgi:hypothetical protein